jgi:hypothetical protein
MTAKIRANDRHDGGDADQIDLSSLERSVVDGWQLDRGARSSRRGCFPRRWNGNGTNVAPAARADWGPRPGGLSV